MTGDAARLPMGWDADIEVIPAPEREAAGRGESPELATTLDPGWGAEGVPGQSPSAHLPTYWRS